MSDADIDAVVLFRPKSIEKLKPFLDLDDEDSDEADEGDNSDNESEGLYAEALDDGSFLVFTFQPYAAFEASDDAALDWLAQFGDVLPEIHVDPRGLLFFPDSCEPEGNTYDAVVAEVGEHGHWVSLEDEEDDLEDGAGAHDLAGQLAAMGVAVPPGVDLGHLEQLATQLLGNASKAPGTTPFEIGQLFEGMQRQLLDAMTAQGQGLREDGEDGEDDEYGDEEDDDDDTLDNEAPPAADPKEKSSK